MNIFILDTNIRKCAQYHCDKHVIKMILETAQILCTVCNCNGIKTPYRSTHVNHPCVLWAGESIQNWRWLRKLARCLNEEFCYRYKRDKNHAAYDVIAALSEPPLVNAELTPFVQVMPDQYKISHDPVTAYRNYYIGLKKSFATWTRRRKPKWFQ